MVNEQISRVQVGRTEGGRTLFSHIAKLERSIIIISVIIAASFQTCCRSIIIITVIVSISVFQAPRITRHNNGFQSYQSHCGFGQKIVKEMKKRNTCLDRNNLALFECRKQSIYKCLYKGLERNTPLFHMTRDNRVLSM
ncbi:uncharacterized protein LOC124936692 [Impatiens glandulifera]|uniref:uncharacterized protein LOC124936692 n=1 Tax=Impatiens glandulifera TaxID=253017 RepID=UPI001FB07904|nr:uncharacterized protein LOC124936692 [Impatiens glandulifera]